MAANQASDKPDSHRYDINPSQIGRALVIMNMNFDEVDHCNFNNKEAYERIIQALRRIGFEVKPYKDLTKERIEAVIAEEALADYTYVSCFLVVICSHGNWMSYDVPTSGGMKLHDIVYGKDGEFLKIEAITAPFKPNNCPSLEGKPKLFLLEHCRGEGEPASLRVTEGASGDVREARIHENEAPIETKNRLEEYDLPYEIPIWRDFFLHYATTQGHKAWDLAEDCQDGNEEKVDTPYLVGAWCEVLENPILLGEEPVQTLATLVNSRISGTQCKQMPQIISMLTQDLYLKKNHLTP